MMSAPPLLRASACQTRIETEFAGEQLMLDACGALFFPEHELLVVSDLHLEKGSFFAARGHPVPCHDTRDTLMRLAEAIRHYRPRAVICLGDSFHDVRAGERMSAADTTMLDGLIASVGDWVWIAGNHDPEIGGRLGAQPISTHRIGPILLSHKPERGMPPLIAGHYHPKYRVPTAERGVSGPCFVLSPSMMLMPAFGAYAGGLNAESDAIAALFAGLPRRHVLIYGGKLWSFE
jgi:DNA ligase-associated metallophosphoesterase